MPGFSRPGFFSEHKLSSSTLKQIYDDVFSSPPILKPFSSSSSLSNDDYADIFSRSNVYLPSSFPVLDDLPVHDFGNVRESGVDYSEIFDGAGDDDVGVVMDKQTSVCDSEMTNPKTGPRLQRCPNLSRSLAARIVHSISSLSQNISAPESNDSLNHANSAHHRSRTIDDTEGKKCAPTYKNDAVDYVQLIVDDANISLEFSKEKSFVQHDSQHERADHDNGDSSPSSSVLTEELDLKLDDFVNMKHTSEEAEIHINLEQSDLHDTCGPMPNEEIEFEKVETNKCKESNKGDVDTVETVEGIRPTSLFEHCVETTVEQSVSRLMENMNVGEFGLTIDLGFDEAKDLVPKNDNIEATHNRRRQSLGTVEQEVITEVDHMEIADCINIDYSDDNDGFLNLFEEFSHSRKAVRVIYHVEEARRRKKWHEIQENMDPMNSWITLVDHMMENSTHREAGYNGKKLERRKLGETSIAKKDENTCDIMHTTSGPCQDAQEDMRHEKEKKIENHFVNMTMHEPQRWTFIEPQQDTRSGKLEEIRQRIIDQPQDKSRKLPYKHMLAPDKATIEEAIRERFVVGIVQAEVLERNRKELVEKFDQKQEEEEKQPIKDNSTLERSHNSIAYNSSGYSRSSNLGTMNAKKKGATSSQTIKKCNVRQEEKAMEQTVKFLEEKTLCDYQAQKEKDERCARALDLEVSKWCDKKEGDLRALLSTLHIILGPDSGWQSRSLADLSTSSNVNTAFKKAMICVHPDKLQQSGAGIKKKYISEKVFHILQNARSKPGLDKS